MPGKTTRSSNLELLRILCMLLIIGDHLTGQSGIADYTTLPSSFAFCLIGCGSRIACSVFVLIGGWFLCEQPYKTRRPLSLWLSLWLYTVPVTLLCKLAGLDVSWGALRWAAFPASTRQLWFISDYLLLLLCVPLLNHLLRGLFRPAHRGLLAVLAVPLIVYPTLFGENGAVSDTAWMFLYEYLLIAYLRRWPDNRLAHLLQHRAAALGLGLGLPLLNTILRAVLETSGLTDGKAFQYMAYYRTALGALPDLLAALVEKYGAENYIVDIGGEVRCRGLNRQGRAWRIGVETPFDGNMSDGEYLQKRIQMTGGGLATSGNYRRFYLDGEGNKVAHTIDPRTGRSALSRLLSVTVAAPTCAEADALGTMFLAMGADDALAAVERMPGVKAYFILAGDGGEYEEYVSPAMEALILK